MERNNLLEHRGLVSSNANINENTPVLMVYFSENYTWRGFVYPYDITTEVNTKNGAIQCLRDMAAIYEEMLDEHDRPDHLVNRPLTNHMDVQFHRLYLKGKVLGIVHHAEPYIR